MSMITEGFINVSLYNQDTSLNYDTYQIVDTLNNNRTWTTPPIQGGQAYAFECAADDFGVGDLYITNVTNQSPPVHFSPHDGDELRD
jgi:hypothetical protein